MNQLPIVPQPGTAICAADIERIEAHVSREIAAINDLDVLQEWRAQAAALEAYLRGKSLSGPMLGAQRRVEARIGQLLGEGRHGGDRRSDQVPSSVLEISANDRGRFRRLAVGLERGLADSEWRSAREPLLKLIQERYPMPRHVPEVMTANGVQRKSQEVRAKEISALAATGARAVQIANTLNITEQQVRSVAKATEITLPDAAIKSRRPNAIRIIEQTVSGIAAYVDGLQILEEIGIPDLEAAQVDDWLRLLSSSISGLKKLHAKLRGRYERPGKIAV